MRSRQQLTHPLLGAGALVVLLAACVSCDSGSDRQAASVVPADATSADMENLVRRSYQYVALFNTLNNFVVNDKNPFATGGWNKTHYPTGLMDASVRAIPRPNNDSFYVLSMLDLRKDAVVIQYPAFSSRTSPWRPQPSITIATSRLRPRRATSRNR